MKIENCKRINLPKFTDVRGNLTVIESQNEIPFNIARVYYLYDIPGGESRAGHAHKQLEQLFIAVSGSFDLVLRDGNSTQTFHLNRPYQGVYVCPMIWREVNNFSSGSVCLVLASLPFDEQDYYRNYNQYLLAKGLKK